MGTKRLVIRKATKKDTALLARLGRKTFSQTYANAHSKSDMDTYLKTAFSRSELFNDITNKNNMFFIAETGSRALGYAKLTPLKEQKKLKEKKTIELERLYIIRGMAGKGIGSKLLQKALQKAVQEKYRVIWLSVWSRNPKAILFYKRSGFKKFGTCVFKLGAVKRRNYLMKRTLRPEFSAEHI